MPPRDRIEDIRDDLPDNVAKNEPIVNTPILDTLVDANLPLRGKFRQRVLMRAREQVRERRTVESVSRRIAQNVTNPFTSALEREVTEVTQKRVNKRIKEMVEARAQDRGESE